MNKEEDKGIQAIIFCLDLWSNFGVEFSINIPLHHPRKLGTGGGMFPRRPSRHPHQCTAPFIGDATLKILANTQSKSMSSRTVPNPRGVVNLEKRQHLYQHKARLGIGQSELPSTKAEKPPTLHLSYLGPSG